MPYYTTRPICGAHLDPCEPCEPCDCQSENKEDLENE